MGFILLILIHPNKNGLDLSSSLHPPIKIFNVFRLQSFIFYQKQCKVHLHLLKFVLYYLNSFPNTPQNFVPKCNLVYFTTTIFSENVKNKVYDVN